MTFVDAKAAAGTSTLTAASFRSVELPTDVLFVDVVGYGAELSIAIDADRLLTATLRVDDFSACGSAFANVEWMDTGGMKAIAAITLAGYDRDHDDCFRAPVAVAIHRYEKDGQVVTSGSASLIDPDELKSITFTVPGELYVRTPELKGVS